MKIKYFTLFALALCGCDGQSDRLAAIKEVEVACNLPVNSLPRAAAEAPASVGEVAFADKSETEIRKFIYLGSGFTGAVIEKRDCILNYHSQNGYWFTIYGVSPTSI